MKKILVILSVVCAHLCVTAQQIDTLVINNGRRAIFGLLNRPDTTATPRPIAIVAHGFNGGYKFGRNYFQPLAEAGYQCYTLDFPCGSTHSTLDSNTVNMSIRDQQADLYAVVDYFRSQPYVDSDNIVLIGESQGGLVASLAATERPGTASRLILVYPAYCIPDHHNSRLEIPDTTYVWRVPLGRRFFTELKDMNPYTALPTYTNPVLIIHGDKDKVVPLSYSERAVQLFPDARLKIIEGAGHGFGDKFSLSASYIKSFLTAGQP